MISQPGESSMNMTPRRALFEVTAVKNRKRPNKKWVENGKICEGKKKKEREREKMKRVPLNCVGKCYVRMFLFKCLGDFSSSIWITKAV